uniref:Uncharacterized protein n=1 Tax=Lactuca sativa TaxID=4236 RepID=A0A9R1WVR7_LACSA|nr:hypothetical protein LSAT_V11C800390330 [Lactuca sativa]
MCKTLKLNLSYYDYTIDYKEHNVKKRRKRDVNQIQSLQSQKISTRSNLTRWDEEKGWRSTDATKKYEEMMKLRNKHTMDTMSDKLILEKGVKFKKRLLDHSYKNI